MADRDRLPTPDQAARDLQAAADLLRRGLAEERREVARQLAATDRHLERARADLAVIEDARARLVARLEEIDRLDQDVRRTLRAGAVRRFS